MNIMQIQTLYANYGLIISTLHKLSDSSPTGQQLRSAANSTIAKLTEDRVFGYLDIPRIEILCMTVHVNGSMRDTLNVISPILLVEMIDLPLYVLANERPDTYSAVPPGKSEKQLEEIIKSKLLEGLPSRFTISSKSQELT